jgi:hypothetical protein
MTYVPKAPLRHFLKKNFKLNLFLRKVETLFEETAVTVLQGRFFMKGSNQSVRPTAKQLLKAVSGPVWVVTALLLSNE